MKVGDKVRCPYNLTGTIGGFISPTDVLVDVVVTSKSMRGKKVIISENKQVHYYTVDQLEVIE